MGVVTSPHLDTHHAQHLPREGLLLLPPHLGCQRLPRAGRPAAGGRGHLRLFLWALSLLVSHYWWSVCCSRLSTNLVSQQKIRRGKIPLRLFQSKGLDSSVASDEHPRRVWPCGCPGLVPPQSWFLVDAL